jgi:chemotaxis protein methyltransferase CheR
MRKSTFDYIQQLLLKTTAISLDTHKSYLVETRLTPLARKYGAASVDQLVDRFRLESCATLKEEIVNAMTTNETFFFRDKVPFESLRDVVLPHLFRQRVARRQICIWCAACSSGQEPYSIAMVLREYFPNYLDWDIRLIGSDLSTEAIEQARRGVYSEIEANRGLPEELRNKYLRKRSRDWQLSDELRSMVEYRHINLVTDWPPLPKMDVVFLRNVMVYWDEATKRQILRRVRAQMKPDGYLFLGGAETTANLDRSFQQVQSNGFSFYQPRQA